MNRKNSNKGFSLVELIIVIAIMAILAVAIGLTIIRYINKARKADDITTAESIGVSVSAAMASDEDMRDFLQWNLQQLGNSNDYRVLGYSSVATGSTGTKYNTLFTSNNIGSSHATAAQQGQVFAQFMNDEMGGKLAAMKFTAFSKIDQWILCVDKNGNLSVWVGASMNGNQWSIDYSTHKTSNGNHYYMLWPEVDKAYERLARPGDAN